MSADHDDEKYTKPALHRRIKQELQESSKGGRQGQWSARKSRMLVQEYERQGGGYKQDANRGEAKTIGRRTEQDWQTEEGSASARRGSTMKRHLPKRAWNLLTDGQRQTAETKQTSQGEQFVPHTQAATAARAYVAHDDPRGLNEEELKRLTKAELVRIARDEELPNRSKMNKAQLARTLRKHFRRLPR